MKKKVFRAIMLVAAGVLLASLVIIMECLYNYFADVQENQLRDEVELVALAVEDSGTDYLDKLQSERYRITLVSADGVVLYDTKGDAAGMENHADREEINEAIQTGEGESVRFSSTLLEKTIYSTRRLSNGAVLRMSISLSTAAVLTFGMLRPILIVLVLALILAAILADRISKRIAQPLNSLDLDKPLENETYEEISPLLSRINQQQHSIVAQLQQLQRQRDEFSQITGSMREGLVLLDAMGRIVSINPMAARLFAAGSECVGNNFLTVDRSSEISRAIEMAIADGHSEIRAFRSGRLYQFDISRIGSGSDVIGCVLLAFDVTEQEFLERNRREFTANVSHELKTPLHSIIGSAELIENDMVKSEDLPRFVGHIRQEAVRLVALIEDIIRLSQLDEGVLLPFEDVEMMGLAEEVVVNLNDAAETKNLQVSVTGEAVNIRGVRRLLYDIIYNLCDNAIRYNAEGGSIDVTVTSDEDNAILTVMDSGIGISPEHQSRVFERFYRVDKSHSKQSGGTGLGLSIVKHAVAYHHGKIDLQSKAGQGTTITVWLSKVQQEN